MRQLLLLTTLLTGCAPTSVDVDLDNPDGTNPGDPLPFDLADEVDSSCVDGRYREQMVLPDADLSALVAGFDTADAKGFLLDALGVRYGIGESIMSGGLQADNRDCFELFTDASQTSSASGTLMAASTVVHECGHLYDTSQYSADSATYVITPDLSFTCSGGRDTMLRSEITGDAFGSDVPSDGYRDIYLTGSMGAQGFDMLLEEAVQYVNSLASDYAFVDQHDYTVSARDGILTFLWYIERYLTMARDDAPATWALLSQDPCWQEAILTVWGRGWLYLAATEDIPQLAYNTGALEVAVRTPDLLDSIDALRDQTCP